MQTQSIWDPELNSYLAAALGSERWSSIQAALTRPPLSVCLRVNTLRSTLEEVLAGVQQHLAQHSSCDAAPARTPLAVPPTSNSIGSQHKAEGQSSSSPSNTQTPPYSGHSQPPEGRGSTAFTCHQLPHFPHVVLVKGSGPHPLQLPEPGLAGLAQVVVSRHAGEAVLRGAHVFVPGVLGVSRNMQAGDPVLVLAALQDAPISDDSSTLTKGSTLRHLHQEHLQHLLRQAQPAGPHTAQQQQQQEKEDSQEVQQPLHHNVLLLGVGRAVVGRVELARQQQGVAVELVQRVWQVPPLNGVLPGQVMLQNLPSVVAGVVLSPPPGSRVLDMCAAPGGKTTLLAQLMGNQGEVVALDRSHAKVDEIKSLAQELGVTIITAHKMDATKALLPATPQHAPTTTNSSSGGSKSPGTSPAQLQPAPSGSSNPDAAVEGAATDITAAGAGGGAAATIAALSDKAQQRLRRRLAAMALRGHVPPASELRAAGLAPQQHPGFPAESFDHILLDAPCTALGVRPRLQSPHTLEALLQTAAYQRRLLGVAVQLLRPGGTLVYSTCSFNPGENEANVRYLLDTHSCLELVPALPRVGGPGLMGPHDREQLLRTARAATEQVGGATGPAGVLKGSHSSAAGSQGTGAGAASPDSLSNAALGPVAAAAKTVIAGDWRLSQEEASMVQRFHPGDPLDTIGFFIARFAKRCSCNCSKSSGRVTQQ